ncbi:hypothetical protein CDAR_66881 [Caerostris darwini]|uniref:Uncharacterized protein n=1 Tax=Caerostris darwini TaxID=1538125 RepID=A0AAV4QWT4_9ARAC|nr:hypothetical protein CDAR_66881 [Caerostris darwini]
MDRTFSLSLTRSKKRKKLGDSDELQREGKGGSRVTRGPLIFRDSLINWLPCVTRTALLQRKFGNDALPPHVRVKKKTARDKWLRNDTVNFGDFCQAWPK